MLGLRLGLGLVFRFGLGLGLGFESIGERYLKQIKSQSETTVFESYC